MKQLRFIDPYAAARAAALVVLVFSILSIVVPGILSGFKFIVLGNIHLIFHNVVSMIKLIGILLVTSYISVLIMCLTYNWYAKKWGGIEVDLC
ncbi:hypothetical protein EB093_07185 [bacterium]|nr:hypothetical protein [bacterium]